MRFTAWGRRLLAAVFELVEEIEADFEQALPAGAFARLREGLQQVATRIDPGGAFGEGDEPVASRGPKAN